MPVLLCLCTLVIQDRTEWFPDHRVVTLPANTFAFQEGGTQTVKLVALSSGSGDVVTVWAPDGKRLPDLPEGHTLTEKGTEAVHAHFDVTGPQKEIEKALDFERTEQTGPTLASTYSWSDDVGRATLAFSPRDRGALDLRVRVPIEERCVARYPFATEKWTQDFTEGKVELVTAKEEAEGLLVKVNLFLGERDFPTLKVVLNNGRTLRGTHTGKGIQARPGWVEVEAVFEGVGRQDVKAVELKVMDAVTVVFPGVRLSPK
ncbi:MAG: hypothetical protein KIT11_04295 [Fimbriimonadaceae bacterium]|nr:hypothetical protein [Fimbriimonadaceae bacterium]QYK56884.1 MAG: hypothetical protein KF733_05230 [Fimbriimonadaceae bacterium]